MAEPSTTARTKNAVRAWAGMGEDDPLVLDTKLEKLRPGALNPLRSEVNDEFEGEDDFPIPLKDWTDLAPKTVRDVRDECRKRRGV